MKTVEEALGEVELTEEMIEAIYGYLITSSVDKGMIYLDQHAPKGWVRRINLDTLNMGCPRHCVLGQLYGHYCTGAQRLNLSTWSTWSMGLFIPLEIQASQAVQGRMVYQDLTAEWRKRLALAS